MAVPWLQLFDAAMGVVNFARSRKAPQIDPITGQQLEPRSAGMFGALETRLTGVVVAALKEAFDRDARRLDLEREMMEAERQRAERALRLELLRQAADREIGRLRMIGGVAIVSFIGTLLITGRAFAGGTAARVLLGLGWTLLLAALGVSFSAQSQIEDAIQRESMPSGSGGRIAPWLIIAALALVGLAALLA